MLARIIQAALLAASMTLSGCCVVRRAETFVEAWHDNFSREYTIRSDPNLFSQDKYRSLQALGEIQRQVENRTLERSIAREQIEREQLDEDALRAVRAIAQHAVHDAVRASIPEVAVLEHPPIFRRDSHNTLSDLFRIRLNASVSFSDRQIAVEPTLCIGRYKVTYTSNETFSHRITYRNGRWFLRAGVEHDFDGLLNANGAVLYAPSPASGISASYSYTREADDHMIGVGFSAQF